MFNANHITKILFATIKNIIVAFIYSTIFLFTTYYLFNSKINNTLFFLNLISIDTNKKILKDVKIDLVTKNLQNYPEYGTKYANLKITSLNIDKPVTFGDTLTILKSSLGHSSNSYFPGEGGSIVYMGHNTSNMLKNLPNIKIDDKIIVETSYGTYEYAVYDMKVINATDLDMVPIQRNKEILMLYTCKRTGRIGYSTKRFIVYANLVKGDN